MSLQTIDPVFKLPWTKRSLSMAYQHFQIKDEFSICPCRRRTARVFDGRCYSCHVKLFEKLGRSACPPLP